MKSIFTKKDVTYNLRALNILTLCLQYIQKVSVFTILVLVPVTYAICYQTI